MASSKDYLQFVLEQLSELQEKFIQPAVYAASQCVSKTYCYVGLIFL